MNILNLFQTISTTFRTLFDGLTMPLDDFITEYNIGAQWFQDLINNIDLDSILGVDITLGGIVFGVTLLGIFIVQIVYFFIP